MLRFLIIATLLVFLYGCAVPVASLPHPPATTAAPLVAAQPSYDTKFDNVDIDEILSQERLLKNYVRCLEGTGPCTPDAKMLKEILPDAMSTDCAKCSEKQKYGSEKVTHYLIDNRPDDWLRLEKIYDPQGTYRRAYLAAVQQDKDNTGPTTPTTTTEA